MRKFIKEPVQLSLFDFTDSDLKNGVKDVKEIKDCVMNKGALLSSSVCILRIKEVEQIAGFKRSYIYRLMKEGRFPQQVRIGLRAVGWSSRDIEHWIGERFGHAMK